MVKCYLGVDIGSISTKAVVIDDKNNILASKYLWTEGDPIGAVKNVLKCLKETLDGKKIVPEIYGIRNNRFS